MLYLALFVVILMLVIIITTFIKRFTLVRIEGISMSPTYIDGQYRLVDRNVSPERDKYFSRKIKEGSILVYYSPEGVAVIKRLISITHISKTEAFYWFEGDNKDYSKDSRHYGFIREDRIYGEVVNLSTFLKRTFALSGIKKEEKEDG